MSEVAQLVPGNGDGTKATGGRIATLTLIQRQGAGGWIISISPSGQHHLSSGKIGVLKVKKWKYR
jgi:hypothetical protein